MTKSTTSETKVIKCALLIAVHIWEITHIKDLIIN